MARNQIRQLGGVGGFRHGDQRLFGDVLLDLGIALEFGRHRAQQRLDRSGIARCLGQVFGARLEKAVIGQVFGDAHARLPLDQDLHGPIGQFQQLQHIRQHTGAIDPVGGRIVDGRVDLARQQDLLVIGHHLFQRADGFLTSDEKRHDHVREHNDIAQRKNGIGGVQGFLHARSFVRQTSRSRQSATGASPFTCR